MSELIQRLNAKTPEERQKSLTEIKNQIESGARVPRLLSGSVNNHIHTTYSFSPYSPTLAMYKAWENGLATAGIMDHDSIGGAREFLQAGKLLGLAATVGLECRVSMKNTKLSGKRINNPDQDSIAYVALHGVPHMWIDKVNDFFAPYREKRNVRNRKMCENINMLTETHGIAIDFDGDVLPLSNSAAGGSVTERHILFALAKKLIEAYPAPTALVEFLRDELGIELSGGVRGHLLSALPQYYAYDILGALKSGLVEKFYVDADEECPDVSEFIALARTCGAIAAYAYLGDVGHSVTGDKKTQRFEDGYLALLFEELSRLGFHAVTYMPARNTEQQLRLVMDFCDRYSLFQISGEDINSPRQSFVCEALEKDQFKHLYASTYALIGHERAASKNIEDGMFTDKTMKRFPCLADRVEYFEKIGRTQNTK